jgi:hypothetical protein
MREGSGPAVIRSVRRAPPYKGPASPGARLACSVRACPGPHRPAFPPPVPVSELPIICVSAGRLSYASTPAGRASGTPWPTADPSATDLLRRSYGKNTHDPPGIRPGLGSLLSLIAIPGRSRPSLEPRLRADQPRLRRMGLGCAKEAAGRDPGWCPGGTPEQGLSDLLGFRRQERPRSGRDIAQSLLILAGPAVSRSSCATARTCSG